jgi:hypothetical protein
MGLFLTASDVIADENGHAPADQHRVYHIPVMTFTCRDAIGDPGVGADCVGDDASVPRSTPIKAREMPNSDLARIKRSPVR